jgi:hypothetical protein
VVARDQPSLFVEAGGEDYSVGVEPDLDAIGVVQTDEDRSSFVADDDASVRLTEIVEPLPPRFDVGAGGNGESDRVEAGQRRGAFPVLADRELDGPARMAQSETHHDAILGELQRDLEAENVSVPGVRLRATSATGSLTWWNPAIAPISTSPR